MTTTTTDDVTHLRALLADATARAERAEAERDAAIEGDAAVFFNAEDRARTEAERDAALAACAEVRAALEAVARRCGGCNGRGERTRPCLYCDDSTHDHVCDEQKVDCEMCKSIRALLARTDLGRGWVSPEDMAQMVGALQMVESDGEFDSLHEVTRKFVVDVLALLKKGGG